MERREEQPSSTDELAYGRPAEDQERRYEGAAGQPDPGRPQAAPAEPDPAPDRGARPADPGSSRAPDTGAPRPEESAPQGGGAPMGAEGAGAPAAEPARPAEPGPGPAGGTGAEHGGATAAHGAQSAQPQGDQGHGGVPGAQSTHSETGQPGAGEHSAGANGAVPLLSSGDADTFEQRWQDIQVGFVDEPSRCVEQADALVADVMKRLAEGFAEERKSLEGQWSRGDEVSTEDLRVALQRYRSFFNRLLSTSG